MSYFQDGFVWLNDPLNWTNPGGLLDRLQEHLVITFWAVLLACLVGLPLGVWLGRLPLGADHLAPRTQFGGALRAWCVEVVPVSVQTLSKSAHAVHQVSGDATHCRGAARPRRERDQAGEVRVQAADGGLAVLLLRAGVSGKAPAHQHPRRPVDEHLRPRCGDGD